MTALQSTDHSTRIVEDIMASAGESLMLSQVYGYYKQTWIQMKKERPC